jgi:hypothetical protein
VAGPEAVKGNAPRGDFPMKKSHILLMLLCCLIPLAGIAAIALFRVPTSSVLYFGLVLLCPLMHVLMMGTMRHDQTSAHSSSVVTPGPSCHPAAETGKANSVDARPVAIGQPQRSGGDVRAG